MQRGRDVVFMFFGTSWAHAVERGFMFSEDRLSGALLEHPEVRRVLVCDPYRSVLGVASDAVRRRTPAPFPSSDTARLHQPLRLRRSDPHAPARSVARYEASVRRAARRFRLERPVVITTHPIVAGFGRFDWAGPVTYYAFDDWSASVPHRPWWPAFDEAYSRLRTEQRRAVAITERALERIAPTGPSAVVPNGVEPKEWLELGPPPAWFAAKAHPRLLYVGSLESRVDVEQVRATAEVFPDASVTLVGKLLDPGHFESLRALPNVEVHGTLVSRDEVVRLIAASDVCLVPHVRNPLTEAMSPLKLYEYLAGGRPVAAVDLPPIAKVKGRIALVGATEDFPAAVQRALDMGPASEEERRAFVAEHSWQRRFDALLELALAV
ncbi:glycosyltransferase [Solirubrobacter taibaiensis]|nr:glycosyltransferase [Solirubrobacter taibaiensis]